MTDRAFRVCLSFWGSEAEYYFPTREDAEHVAHYFREHTSQSEACDNRFIFKTNHGGFIAGLTDPKITKEIWHSSMGDTWHMWDRFTTRSHKVTPLPPLSVPPTNERFACFHAAAVCNPASQGLLFLGPSFSGKTALSLALSFSGWGLLTDDLSVVDPVQMHIHAFRRPVGIRQNTFVLLPQLRDALAHGAKATRIHHGETTTHMVHAADVGLPWLPNIAELHALIVLSNAPEHHQATLSKTPSEATDAMLRDNHFSGLPPSQLEGLPIWTLSFNLERHLSSARELISNTFKGHDA